MPNDHLYTVAQEILSTAVDILVDAEIEVLGRTFVTFGEIADDCDLMAVAWQAGPYTGIVGQPNNQPEGFGFVQRAVTYELRRLQCVAGNSANGTPPSSDELNEDSESILTSLWVIYQGFVARKADKTFLSACDGFSIGTPVPIGPLGNMGGWSLPLEVQVL